MKGLRREAGFSLEEGEGKVKEREAFINKVDNYRLILPTNIRVVDFSAQKYTQEVAWRSKIPATQAATVSIFL